MTGASLPIDKDVHPVATDAPLAERSTMLFKGTAVARGSGEGVAVATGMATELGRATSSAPKRSLFESVSAISRTRRGFATKIS
jgi:Ca2+-transporting ATPase